MSRSLLPRALARALVFFSLSLSVWLVPQHAHAKPGAPRLPAGARALGLVTEQPLAALAGAQPSAAEPLGTVMLVWCSDPFAAPAVHLGEWSLQSSRWLSNEVVRRPELCPVTFRMAWSKARLLLVIGHDSAELTDVVAFDRSGSAAKLTEAASITFENAQAPSLDAGEHVVALATYERRAPVETTRGPSRLEPAVHALHVRLLDPTTLAVVNARVLTGPRLLRRHGHPEVAGHAVRLRGDRLDVAVVFADHDPRVITTRALPSLATDRERGEATALEGFPPRTLGTFDRKEPPYTYAGEALGILPVHGHGVVLGALHPMPADGRSGATPWAIRVLP